MKTIRTQKIEELHRLTNEELFKLAEEHSVPTKAFEDIHLCGNRITDLLHAVESFKAAHGVTNDDVRVMAEHEPYDSGIYVKIFCEVPIDMKNPAVKKGFIKNLYAKMRTKKDDDAREKHERKLWYLELKKEFEGK